MPDEPRDPVELFVSYSHRDDELREELVKHLAPLRREKVSDDWHDRRITAGQEWDKEIDEHLDSARVILMLVSADFLDSDYCYDVEVQRAMGRHERGEAVVIPIILRPCDWERAPFGKLQALPAEGKPVSLWPDRDSAFLDVAKGIGRALEKLRARKAVAVVAAPSPTRTAPPIPRAPAVGFVARRDEGGQDILKRWLLSELPHGKIIALWGPGGSGKTTLAAEAARTLRARFPDRLAWVSALGRPDFSLSSLLDDIITQLAPGAARPAMPEQKEALVRGLVAEAPMLVVLDNLETIASLDEQTRCLDFLSGCGECPALVTTRWGVEREDVTNVRVAAMERDEAREFLRRLIERSGKPFAFEGQDHDELINECEANPLVLQWAVGQIVRARRAQDVLADIRQGRGDAAQRFFTRSFELPYLGDDGRAALLALSLFAPDASREALAHAAGFGADVPRLEASVVRLASLWLADTTPGNKRLLLRGLTRELARARLDAERDAPEFRRRFISYFLGYAEARSKITTEDFDALEAERENLLGAFDHAFTLEDWRSVMSLRAALEEYLDVRGHWGEAVRAGEQALYAARSSQHEPAIARFTHNLALMHQKRGAPEEARRLYNESLEINRRLGDQRGIAISLHQLGRLAQDSGELEEARRLYNESLKINRRLGDQGGIASSLHQLAILAQYSGELGEARRLYNESLEINRGLGNQGGIAGTLHQLGWLAQDSGELEEARHLYNESLEINRRLGNQSGIAGTLHQLGRLAQDSGELEEARRLYNESLKINRRLGDQSGIAITLHELGRLAYRTGELEEAQRLLGESVEITKRLGDQNGTALSLIALGVLEERKGDGEQAARLYREALGILDKLGSPDAEYARRGLARVEGEGDEGGG